MRPEGQFPVMITRVRKFGDGGAFLDVDHTEGECAFCVVARGNLTAAGDVIFFETDAGRVQRTECIGLASDGSPAFYCFESAPDEAQLAIARYSAAAAGQKGSSRS